MIKEQVWQQLHEALAHCTGDLKLDTAEMGLSALALERPKQAKFGDFAVNVSPLARYAKLPPPKIAEIVSDAFKTAAPSLEPSLAGGFINFKVSTQTLQESLARLLAQAKPGQNTQLATDTVLLEFVSANPTGPLHIGHGRWMALGNTLARLLRHSGATVWQEFYVNDYGNQMNHIAHSLWLRCLQHVDQSVAFPEKVGDDPYPYYAGDYVIEMADTFMANDDNKTQFTQWQAQTSAPEYTPPDAALKTLKAEAKFQMMAAQKQLMEKCGLVFDLWFSETDLHQAGEVDAMLGVLKDRGFAYEKDGALWLASSKFDDDQDRVLIKTDGSYTYLTADIAYHWDKFTREDGRFTKAINIWGADHHGYIARMKAAVAAMGFDPDRLEIVLGQLVNLKIDGQRTRMGKRKKMLTLSDLVDEVGVDAVRFWMISKSQDTTLDFDVDLAASASDENPVFYVQYAHARCASIFRNALEPQVDTEAGNTKPAFIDPADWQQYVANVDADQLARLFTDTQDEAAQIALRELILKLDNFEDKVVECANKRYPHMMARYLMDLASDFHSFYAHVRVLVDDPEVAKPRLLVIEQLRRTLAQGLELLGVSAPSHM